MDALWLVEERLLEVTFADDGVHSWLVQLGSFLGRINLSKVSRISISINGLPGTLE